MTNDTIVFYAGECKFCDATVSLITRHEKDKNMKFVHLQDDDVRNQLMEMEGGLLKDSIYFLEKGHLYKDSSAALKIAKHLNVRYSLIHAFIIFPPLLRDPIYKLIAKYRKRIVGTNDSCVCTEEYTVLPSIQRNGAVSWLF